MKKPSPITSNSSSGLKFEIDCKDDKGSRLCFNKIPDY